MKLYIAVEPETDVMFASPCFKTVYNTAVLEMRYSKDLHIIQVFTIDSDKKWIHANFERHVIDLIRCVDNSAAPVRHNKNDKLLDVHNSVALVRHDKNGKLLDVHNITLREIDY